MAQIMATASATAHSCGSSRTGSSPSSGCDTGGTWNNGPYRRRYPAVARRSCLHGRNQHVRRLHAGARRGVADSHSTARWGRCSNSARGSHGAPSGYSVRRSAFTFAPSHRPPLVAVAALAPEQIPLRIVSSPAPATPPRRRRRHVRCPTASAPAPGSPPAPRGTLFATYSRIARGVLAMRRRRGRRAQHVVHIELQFARVALFAVPLEGHRQQRAFPRPAVRHVAVRALHRQLHPAQRLRLPPACASRDSISTAAGPARNRRKFGVASRAERRDLPACGVPAVRVRRQVGMALRAVPSATAPAAVCPRCSAWHCAHRGSLSTERLRVCAGARRNRGICGKPGPPLLANACAWHASQRLANNACARETGPLVSAFLPPTPSTSGTQPSTASAVTPHVSRLRRTASTAGRSGSSGPVAAPRLWCRECRRWYSKGFSSFAISVPQRQHGVRRSQHQEGERNRHVHQQPRRAATGAGAAAPAVAAALRRSLPDRAARCAPPPA